MTHHWLEQAKTMAGPVPMRSLQVDVQHYRDVVASLKAEGYRCVSLMGYWEGIYPSIELALTGGHELLLVLLALPMSSLDFPDISDIYPCTQRMQRATYDLCGLRARRPEGDIADARPWLNHGWPDSYFPLHPASEKASVWQDRDYDFISVSGAGVHEIAVGPVHAGIIEPGHFRFSVVGEKVLRLEQRLGYTHRGTAQTLSMTPWPDAGKLVGRLCGDSTVAYSWAWCMALEQAAGISIPPRATWLRALLLERERIANHLGDLGALANDAGWTLPLSWLSRLREDCLREQAAWCGHRLLMDTLQPGGCSLDISDDRAMEWQASLERLEQEIIWIQHRFEEHGGMQDRFLGTGCVSPELALALGLSGLAGRASGQGYDVRVDSGMAPYDQLNLHKQIRSEGDVAARVQIRFAEVLSSIQLMSQLLAALPPGPVAVSMPSYLVDGHGHGWVEGWRGGVLVSLYIRSNALLRVHVQDPSWLNWPVLEYAIMDNIVADFPLINKSFNLAYAGHDL